MDKRTVEKQIKDLLVSKTKFDNADAIDNMAPINEYLNSITYIQFLIAVEDEFDLDLDDEVLDVANFQNLNDILHVLYTMLELD